MSYLSVNVILSRVSTYLLQAFHCCLDKFLINKRQSNITQTKQFITVSCEPSLTVHSKSFTQMIRSLSRNNDEAANANSLWQTSFIENTLHQHIFSHKKRRGFRWVISVYPPWVSSVFIEASFLILVTFLVEHKNCFSLKCSFRKVTVSKHNIRAIKQYLPFSGTWWRFIDIKSAFLGSNFIFIWNVNTKSRLILHLRGFGFRGFSWWNQLENRSVIPQSVASLALLNSWFPIKNTL